MYLPNSRWTWTFLLVTIVQACVVLAFECYVFATFQEDLRNGASNETQARTIPTFLTLYIFGFIYQLVLVYDALRLKNTIQIIGLVLYNVGLLIYGAVQMDTLHDAVNQLSAKNEIDLSIWDQVKPYLIAIPCVLALGTVILMAAAWKLNDEFAWTIYKHISADLKMKKRYLTFQVYIALLKFDFFFFLGFTVQFVVIVTQRKSEFALTIAAIPVTIIILLAAAFFCRREVLLGTIVVIILYFGAMAYFVFKLVRMYSPHWEVPYLPARKELTAFAVLTLVLLILTILNSCLCAANYGKGLRPYVEHRKVDTEEEKFATSGYAPYATEMQPGKAPHRMPSSHRMEID